MIILLIGVDEREGWNTDLQYLVYIRWVSISFLNGFIDNESKNKTMEEKNPTLINFLPTFHQQMFRIKVEAFSQFSFSSATPEKSHLDSIQVYVVQLKCVLCSFYRRGSMG